MQNTSDLKLTKKDIIIVAILGEIVGSLGYAIVNAQPSLSNLFMKFVPASLLLPLFAVVVPLAAIVALILAFLMAKKIAPVFFQMGKFAAVGFSNTAIDWGIFNLILKPLGFPAAGLIYALGKAISFGFATTNSFFWNKTWSFEKKGTSSLGKEAMKFYMFTAIGLAINVGVATTLVFINPGSELFRGVIAPACATAVSMIWDFIAYKFFVFKKPVVKAEQA